MSSHHACRVALVAVVLLFAARTEPGVAAQFTVNSTSDAVDVRAGDGVCRTSSARCTLRAAVQEANALAGHDTIVLRASTYTLSRSGLGEDAGDFDVTDATTIAGAGASSTVLDGGTRPRGAPPLFRGLDRLLEIHPGAGEVTVSGLTIRDGSSFELGGGILAASDGRLLLDAVTVTASYALLGGSGLAATGSGAVDIRRSAFTAGAAITAFAGTLTLENSTLSGAGLLGAGLAEVHLESSTVSGAGIGQGLGSGQITLRNTVAAGGCSGVVASEGGNVDRATTCGLKGPGDRSDADPQLAALASNGGPTPSHALRQGSAALDAGLLPCPATDQRGFPRPQGASCDAGAYEAVPSAPDLSPPDTAITSAPAALSGELTASFSFTGTDDVTPAGTLAFQCRLDTAAVWTPCASPVAYPDLSESAHVFEVRARDGAGNVDPTPARHEWTIAVCAAASRTLTATGDAWIDQLSPTANKGSDAILGVESGPGANRRALVDFQLPKSPPGCVLESAKLRLYSPSASEGTMLEAWRAAAPWREDSVTWSDQPATVGAARMTWTGEGYLTWNVSSQVHTMLTTGVANGFIIQVADEDSETGGGADFHGREKGENPPQLALRFVPRSDGPPPPPEPPVEAAVSCGEEIRRSTKVINDLTDCLSGDGLVIGAPRIIVDLGGHTIDGVGLGTGIRNDGWPGVTVANGTVSGWDHGVQLQFETRAGTVRDLHLDANEVTGVQLWGAGGDGAAGNEVRSNRLTGNGGGIALVSGTTGTLVADNVLSGNRGAHLLVKDSSANRLERNRVAGEGGGDLGIGLEHAQANTLIQNTVDATSDGGLVVEAGSHGNRIERNALTGTGDAGIVVDASDANRLIGNVAHGMSDSGISLSAANGGLVRGNDVRFNPGGLQLDGSSGNMVEDNEAGATTGIGIEIGGGSLLNQIVRNSANGNGAQGIYVGADAEPGTGNLVAFNTANGNAADGIVTGKGWHVLAANVANGNGGWGISAALETIDGGNNAAKDNREPGQCLGIACLGAPQPGDTPDEQAPETELDSAPATSDGSIEFAFVGEDETTEAASLRFECRLDAGAWEPCTSPWRYTALQPGPHTFAVRAVDAAGNRDATPDEHAWTDDRDVVAPETRIAEGPADASARDVTFTLEGSDAAGPVTFECRLDDEALWEPCASPRTITGLEPGPHTFRARAVDGSGNLDATPATHTWTVRAAVACPASGTLDAEADAWIDENSEDANKGDDSILKIQSKGPGDDFRGLMRFALPSLPEGCAVASATLRLHSEKDNIDRTLEVRRLAAPWSEMTVTWTNRPATVGSAASRAGGEGDLEFDVTALVAAGAGEGFELRDAELHGPGIEHTFYSREKGESPPQLVLRFAAIE